LQSIATELLLQRWSGEPSVEARQPANRRLYECLRQLIFDGSIPAAAKLPASRDLAAVLSVSRNTVKHAYEQLIAEGYLRTRIGSGTFVTDVLPEQVLWPNTRGALHQLGPLTACADRLSARGRSVVVGAQASPVQWGAFVPGVPDVTEYPQRKLDRIAAQWRRSPPAEWLSYASGGGHPGLRDALARYLRQARSVVCEAHQIVITEGVHQAVDLTSRLLADHGQRAWLEEPGYWGVRSVLQMNGLAVDAIPVDEEGLRLSDAHTPPRLIFVTPSHQYPLGSVMSLPRRLRLLDYARQHGSWIVEDDYDSEFRFSGHAIPSLQGLSTDAPVIYIGTFSKTLCPGLRVAYMVLPPALAAPFRTAHAELYREGHLLTQAALAAFIEEGHYASHIRRMRLIYAERRSTLLAMIEHQLGRGWVHPHDSNAGLHLVMTLPRDVDDVLVAKRACDRGVLVRPLSCYYAGESDARGLLLGFAAVAAHRMAKPFDTLVACLESARGSVPAKSRRSTIAA
jgi:GntR family transcriptional regulator / MocR family aminotransferase